MDRFMAALRARGISLSEASRKIGHSRSYFSKMLPDGVLPRHAVIALRDSLGIDPDEYTVSHKPKHASISIGCHVVRLNPGMLEKLKAAAEHPGPDQRVVPKDVTDRYASVYDACYCAVLDALADGCGYIGEALHDASSAYLHKKV